MLHKCKRVSKSVLQIYIFFRSFINFKKIKWCFNNVIKALCMTKWAIHESLLLLLKHHFILLKLITRFIIIKDYLSDSLTDSL